MEKRKRNLGTVDLNESAPVTVKSDFPEQLSDEELLKALEETHGQQNAPSLDDVDVTPVPARPVFADINLHDQHPDKATSMLQGLREAKDSSDKEIQGLLSDLEKQQNIQDMKQHTGRMQAYALNAGEAVRSGFLQEAPHYVDVPPKYDTGKAAETRMMLGDKLKNTESKWTAEELDRQLKQYLGEEGNKTKEDIASKNIEEKKSEAEQKKELEHMKEGGRNERTDKMVRAGLAGKALGINATAGSQGARADAEFANRQAERQIPMYAQVKPNTATDQTTGAELSGSMKGMEDKAGEMIHIMRTKGRNFPQSTEWKNLASDYMTINQLLNRLNQNGVMNFKDKENNDVQIGNAQEFFQYVLGNGPDVLEHSIKGMRLVTNARMYQHGYEYDPNWKPKSPSEYMPQSSGGGMSRSGVDPNAAPAAADWAITGKNPPTFNNPAKEVKAPDVKTGGPQKRKFHWDAQQGKMLDQNGQPL